MTNLTEQWNKGKLPDGYYYCKTENGVEILRTWRGSDGYLNFENICNEVFISSMDDCEVLAEVPSYEQWQASENYIDYLKQCISVYESKEKQHIDDAIAYNELAEENTKLKELLKRARKHLSEQDTPYSLIKKINQVLGEE
jgi:hypothetical protein